jgi:hypothetical protein
LQVITDRTVPPTQQVVNVPLSVSDPNGDPLSFTATAQSLAWLVHQQEGPFTYSPVFDNFYGQGEKWLLASGRWYFLLPTGELFRWNNTNGANGTLVGLIGVGFYQDPSRLQNIASGDPHATLAFAGNTLIVTRDLDWDITIIITVTANDGRGGTDTESFTLFVSG